MWYFHRRDNWWAAAAAVPPLAATDITFGYGPPLAASSSAAEGVPSRREVDFQPETRAYGTGCGSLSQDQGNGELRPEARDSCMEAGSIEGNASNDSEPVKRRSLRGTVPDRHERTNCPVRVYLTHSTPSTPPP